MAFWRIRSSSESKHIFYHINRVGVRIGPALAFCSHHLTAHVGPLYERAEVDRLFLLMCENRQDGLYKGARPQVEVTEVASFCSSFTPMASAGPAAIHVKPRRLSRVLGPAR